MAFASSMMPRFVGDGSAIDAGWIREHTGLACESCEVLKDLSHVGKPRTAMRLALRLEGQERPVRVILKQVPPGTRQQPLAKSLGLPREALFYRNMAPEMSKALLPPIYYAYGDMDSGLKAVLMEELEDTVDSSCFFGPGNPNSWDKDLDALAARAGSPPPSAEVVTGQVFLAIAEVHAKWWRHPELLKSLFLRGASWVVGDGRETWEASQEYARSRWNEAEAAIAAGTPTIRFDPVVLESVRAALAGISWERQRQRLNAEGAWTLVHGDFWPGNVMWRCGGDAEGSRVVLVDWEMVGIGSGAQDLGQFVISNMEPAVRLRCEEQLVRGYYDRLVGLGVSSEEYTWEACWKEYRVGGLERWLWFLCYFAGGPEALRPHAQFFHDQIAAFMRDHQLTAGDIVQVRS